LEPTPRCTVHRLKHAEEKAVIAFIYMWILEDVEK
jgi:hypothetical protein